MKEKRHKITDNIYGGVRYRSSYDHSKRAAAVRVLRLRRRGVMSFRLSVVAVALFCLAVITFVVVYRISDDTVKPEGVSGEQYKDTAVAVNASVCTDRTVDYPGHFRISEMNERANDAYHMPKGVMVTEVYGQDGIIESGDIIIAVDGKFISDITTFDNVFLGSNESSVAISVYRKGKHISLNYIKNED